MLAWFSVLTEGVEIILEGICKILFNIYSVLPALPDFHTPRK
jgi:hypothetical protein